MAKVLFFCQAPMRLPNKWPNEAVVQAVLRHLGADLALFNDTDGAMPGVGFVSNVMWGKLIEEHDLRSVVIVDANLACIYGVSIEAQNFGLTTYELVTYGGNRAILRECNNLQVVGALEVPVVGLVKPPGPG